MSDTAVKSLIDTVKILNDKYDQLEKLTGDKFNIFTILNMESDEVKTHSKFIYELLNPNGSHGSGDLFIRLFLDELPSPKAKDREKPEDKDYGKIIKVIREYTIKNDRRIDFLIETEKYVIGIEMKIYAGDQDDQLSDYCATIQRMCKKSKQKPKLYYLTLFGSDASEKSKNYLKLGKHYQLLSFSNHIYNWMEKCIEKSATKPIVREALIQYQNLIKKLTNKISHNMEEEMEEIIRTPEDIKAAYTIFNEYLTIWAKKEAEFWFDLYEEFEKNKTTEKFDISYDASTYKKFNLDNNEKIKTDFITQIRHTERGYIGIELKYKFDKYQMVFLICKYTKNDAIEINFFLTRYNKEEPIKLPIKIIDILDECGLQRRYYNTYKWEYLLPKISFGGVNSPEPTFDLFKQEVFNKYVNEIANTSIQHIKRVLDRQDEILEALFNKKG